MDFSSMSAGTVEAGLDTVSRGLLQHGVTAYCPTLVTSAQEYYHRVLPSMCPRRGGSNGAAVLGERCGERKREGTVLGVEEELC